MISENHPYHQTVSMLENHLEELIEEMIFFQHAQTSILRNDFYLIKDKDTQAVFECVLKKNQKKVAPNNHLKAYDFKHLGNCISVKSGQINQGTLKLSYSRTTEHLTLDDKIQYLSKFENLILGIASEKLKASSSDHEVSKVRYHLYYFPANHIPFGTMQWESFDSQHEGKCVDSNISVEIKKKMSDQPWISIPIDKIKCRAIMTSTVIAYKNRKVLLIEREDTGERHYYDLYEQRKKMKGLKGIQKCKPTIYTTKNAMD